MVADHEGNALTAIKGALEGSLRKRRQNVGVANSLTEGFDKRHHGLRPGVFRSRKSALAR
jgi:hypothetical protein